MFFNEIVDADGRSTFVVGYGTAAVVVDPGCDVERYLDVAATVGARVRYVLETQAREAFVASRDVLAARSGAAVLGPGAGALPLRSGHVLRVGSVSLIAVAAPSGEPGRLAYVICDLSSSSADIAVIDGAVVPRRVAV